MYSVTDKQIQLSNKRCLKYRKKILYLSQKVGALHIGGSFSSVEILEVIYNFLLKKKDKFILSKGHTGILQYVILQSKNVITNDFLLSYCKKNSKLGVHPDFGNPGIEASTGALGHGLGIASGLALANKNQPIKKNIWVIIGEGELYEGSTWEALLFIKHYNFYNIKIILDRNELIILGKTEDCLKLNPIKNKLEGFGFKTQQIDGHNYSQIMSGLKKLKLSNDNRVLICNTVKGNSVSFMENKRDSHYWQKLTKMKKEKLLKELKIK